MAKVLVALDGYSNFTRDLVAVSRELFSDWKQNLYVGMIVKDLSYVSSLSVYFEKAGLEDHNPFGNELLTEEEQRMTEAISNFTKPAKKWGIKYEIFNDFQMTAYELVKQTMYADLLILSYQIFQNRLTGRADHSLLYYILKGSKCPVLIVPENIRAIENIIFTYDGKESSVYAIKAFASLFSQSAKDKITSILTVTPSLDEEMKNEKFLLDLVKEHFTNVGMQLLEGTDITREIGNFASSVDNPLVIMGAYGRSPISNLLIPSVARGLIQQRAPLFIAHP